DRANVSLLWRRCWLDDCSQTPAGNHNTVAERYVHAFSVALALPLSVSWLLVGLRMVPLSNQCNRFSATPAALKAFLKGTAIQISPLVLAMAKVLVLALH